MRTALLAWIVLLIPILPVSSLASGDWYSGDIRSYSARNTRALISDHVQRGIDDGLDWVVLYGHFGEGLFTGLQAILQEEVLHTWRIAPILGTSWAPGEDAPTELILFGVDARTPVPSRRVGDTLAWVEAQRGISVQTTLRPPTGPGVAFQGLRNGTWASTCDPGGAWDKLLAAGHRIYLVGGTTRPSELATSRTYVWAENNRPEQILDGLRRGVAYVAQADGIRLDMQVNSKPMGSVVPVTNDRVYLRLRGSAHHPISRITIVADGDSLWSVKPEAALWEGRFFLPVEGRTYLRVILESEQGGYQTLGNPVFLVSEAGLPLEEMPGEEAIQLASQSIELTVDSALETLIGLEEAAQNRILSEYLRDARMRYETALALKHREDLILDRQLLDLLQHTDPEVRLGTACALVLRSSVDLPERLIHLLSDTAPQLRTYAARILSQYTGGLHPDLLLPALKRGAHPERLYLLRALDPTAYSTDLMHILISDAQHPHPGISAAALDKLIEMSNRNFKVIRALRDSAFSGHVQAVEALGWIRDRRTVEPLEKIYRRETYGPLKRAAFLALEKMGAPYPDRKEIDCPLLNVPPQIDGLLVPDEWAAAATIAQFSDDAQGNPSPQHQIAARIGRDENHLYMALSCELPDTGASAAWIRLRDVKDPLDEDRVEWAVSVGGAKPRIFSLTPIGAVLDQKDGNPRWDPTWQAAQVHTLDRWTLECAIPLVELGIDSAQPVPHFRFNLSWISGKDRRWTWSVTYGAPKNPDRFGDLILVP